jgi:DNA-binding LacI/PurR family transcriptional regulator
MPKLSFKIKRKKGTSLTDQVAAGLRHEILSGAFRTGDSLPTLMKIAEQTGVSEIVARHAIKRLSKEGLVHAQRRNGIRVINRRGHVLYLTWHDPKMYYHSALCSVVAERLHLSNVLLSVTHISKDEARKGFPKVQADLAHAVSLAVVEGIPNGVDQLLERRGIPFIHFTVSHPSPRAARAVLMRPSLAFSTVRDHCLACGVRKVLLVGVTPDDEQSAQLGRLLADAGMHCSTLGARQVFAFESGEALERRALNAMNTWLKRERRLPDLIWFSDDFVAQGALMAMTARGVRIPQDVQVISWANAGLGPVFVKPLTRVEMDPVQHGEAIAACVLEQLEKTQSSGEPIVLSPVFIKGATTVRQSAKGATVLRSKRRDLQNG